MCKKKWNGKSRIFRFLVSFVCLPSQQQQRRYFKQGVSQSDKILISVNSLAGRTYTLNLEIVFILKSQDKSQTYTLALCNIKKQKQRCVNIGESVCVCQTTLKTTIDLFCFRFSPIFAITYTHRYMRKVHCLNVSKCYRVHKRTHFTATTAKTRLAVRQLDG